MTHALIIDDNQSNSEVLGLMLENEGVTYSSVKQPSRLKPVVKELNAVDVVFLDLKFPNHNGFVILAQLREIESFKNIPIIAYSVHVDMIDEVRRAGFNGFLGKPVDSDQFPAQLKRILAGESVWEIVRWQ